MMLAEYGPQGRDWTDCSLERRNFGCFGETVSSCVRRAEIDTGRRSKMRAHQVRPFGGPRIKMQRRSSAAP
jgi:hypothetical protein